MLALHPITVSYTVSVSCATLVVKTTKVHSGSMRMIFCFANFSLSPKQIQHLIPYNYVLFLVILESLFSQCAFLSN